MHSCADKSCSVLFDEIEKAHPDVMNLLLQILDEGCLTDSHGRKVDFKNTIILLTSNLGANILVRPESRDPVTGQVTEAAKKAVSEVISTRLAPELINRLSEIIVFNALGRSEIAKIVDLRLNDLQKLLQDRHVQLAVGDDVRTWLGERGYDALYGARALNRVIAKEVRKPLAKALLTGVIRDGDEAVVRVKEDGTGLEVQELHEPMSEVKGRKELEVIDEADDVDDDVGTPPRG